MANALDRPSITMGCGANVNIGVELKDLWDWNKCICHVLHLAINASLNGTTIDVHLQSLYKLCHHLHCASMEWKKFKRISKRLWGVGVLNLRVKDRWNVKDAQVQ